MKNSGVNIVKFWAIITNIFIKLHTPNEDARRDLFYKHYSKFIQNFHLKLIASEEFKKLEPLVKNQIIKILKELDPADTKKYIELERLLSEMLGDDYYRIYGDELSRYTIEMIKAIDMSLVGNSKEKFRQYLRDTFNESITQIYS